MLMLSMTLQGMIAVVFMVLISIGFVAIIILLGWFLIWKAFLSKFGLVRELLGQGEVDERNPDHNQGDLQPHAKTRKVRKD